MNHYFLGRKIPTDHQEQLDLIERMESAVGLDLNLIKEELTDLRGEQLAQLASAMLDKTANAKVLTLIVESMTSQHGLSIYERSDILKSVCQHYTNDRIDRTKFERLFVAVIDSAGPRFNQALEVIKIATFDSFRNVSAKNKLMAHSVDFIDQILSRPLTRYPASLDIYHVSTALSTMVGFINLPKTLSGLYAELNAREDEDLKRHILSIIFKGDALSKEYIQVISSKMDIDALCKICSDDNMVSTPTNSISNFIDAFGEAALFPESARTSILNNLQAGIFPRTLNVLASPKLISEKMPILANFLIDNVELIYSSFTDEHFNDVRCGLLRVFAEHNRLEEIMSHDIKHLRTLGWLVLGKCTLAYTLKELQENDSPRYWDAIQGVVAIGLDRAEPFLRCISQPILKDVIDNTDISTIDKHVLFKMYPLSKGLFLENALGL